MARSDIPDIVIGRLPIYLRTLSRLQQEGLEFTSSHELGELLGISSAQIRKDLSHFGEFGKQGTGYAVDTLSQELQRILHVDREWQVVVVGIGDLGRALANYGGFVERGFRITHLFDNDPAKIGQRAGHMVIAGIDEMAEIVERDGVRVAMIATPADSAQQIAEQLIDAGVRSILCYAPIVLSIPPEVHVQYIDPGIHLQRMTYYLND